MKVLGVIPARWASTRLPGKILAPIAGKPMVQHVWKQAKGSQRLTDIVVACDEQHVLDACRQFGANAVMTSQEHASGTDRVAEVARQADADVILSIQSDEPLIRASVIDDLIAPFEQDDTVVVSTPVRRVKNKEDYFNPNIVKVVVDKNMNALYFSRSPLPYFRDEQPDDLSCVFSHLGIYAYRRSFLLDVCSWPKSYLEEQEKLEQLRVLEAGYRIRCVETSVITVSVDVPEDIQRVEDILAMRT